MESSETESSEEFSSVEESSEEVISSEEYSSEWKPGDEPYYPVNDDRNNKLAEEYRKLTVYEDGVIFGGRLGQYKYYDMDQVIAAALDMVHRTI